MLQQRTASHQVRDSYFAWISCWPYEADVSCTRHMFQQSGTVQWDKDRMDLWEGLVVTKERIDGLVQGKCRHCMMQPDHECMHIWKCCKAVCQFFQDVPSTVILYHDIDNADNLTFSKMQTKCDFPHT